MEELKYERLYENVPVQRGQWGGVLVVRGRLAGFLADYDDDEDGRAIIYLNPTGIVGAVQKEEGYYLVPYSHLRRIDEELLFRWVEKRRTASFPPATRGRRFVVLPGTKRKRKRKPKG